VQELSQNLDNRDAINIEVVCKNLHFYLVENVTKFGLHNCIKMYFYVKRKKKKKIIFKHGFHAQEIIILLVNHVLHASKI